MLYNRLGVAVGLWLSEWTKDGEIAVLNIRGREVVSMGRMGWGGYGIG